MNKEDILYGLSQGTYTAVWAHDEIRRQDKRIAELEKELAKTKQSQKSGWLRDSNTHVNKKKEQGE